MGLTLNVYSLKGQKEDVKRVYIYIYIYNIYIYYLFIHAAE